jgi:hypothetical protein
MFQAIDIAIILCITIVILSTMLLALTLVYVSRLKQREDARVEIMPQGTGAEEEETFESLEERIRNLVALKQVDKIDVSSEAAEPPETSLVRTLETLGDEAAKNERVGSAAGGLAKDAETSPKPNGFTKEVRSQIVPTETAALPAVKTLNIKGEPAGMVPPPLHKKDTVTSLAEPETKQAENLESRENPPAPLIKMVNENEVKDAMDNKPKTDHPNENERGDDKQDMSFSDLFTEDTEETETDKLGKQLGDIDAGDIMQMTKNLAEQLKGKRLAVK